MNYKYYFGTDNTELTVTALNSYDTASGQTYPAGTIRLRPWELKHVTSFVESVTAAQSTIGLPNKPPECTYIYDTQGPVRTFTISGLRYDAEEEVSNLDFIHTQFCDYYINSEEYIPYSTSNVDLVFSIGIEWLVSIMQTITSGYRLTIVTDDDIGMDDRMPVGSANTNKTTFNVGLTNFQYNLNFDTPGVMSYTLTLVERSILEDRPTYKRYVPACTSN